MSPDDIVQIKVSLDVIARRDDLDALLEHGPAIEDVAYFISEGAGIGDMGYSVSDVVVLDGPTGPRTIEALLAVGNDGTFFSWMEET